MRAVLFLLSLVSLFAHAHDKVYRGQYTYGHEVSVFQECGNDKLYWLQGSGFLMQEIEAAALAMPKPYTPIYLEFRGHEHFEEVDGFRAEYEYQMHLSEVQSYSAAIPDECQ